MRLVDERLKAVADWASPRHAAGLSVEMPAGLSFHHAEDTPLPLRGLAPGMHEKTVDGVDLHVLVGSDDRDHGGGGNPDGARRRCTAGALRLGTYLPGCARSERLRDGAAAPGTRRNCWSARPSPWAELARQECLRCQSYTAGKPLTLVFADGEDFLVNAPRELLAAAIGNLVCNACQYTLQGEVIVRLAGRALIVEDTGPGLPDAARARLLRQPIPANLSGSSGTGLGLGLVQRICLYLGAELGFSARPAGGSALWIDFI